MNEPDTQLTRGLSELRMTSHERDALRQRLNAFALANPARAGAAAFLVRHAMAVSAAAFLLMAGTATAIADRSGPDDFLYPVRRALTEPVTIALSGDADARLEKELELLGRSIDEEEMSIEIALADLETAADSDVAASGDVRTDDAAEELDASWDAELDAELRVMERILLDEEAGADQELSL